MGASITLGYADRAIRGRNIRRNLGISKRVPLVVYADHKVSVSCYSRKTGRRDNGAVLLYTVQSKIGHLQTLSASLLNVE